MSKVIPFQQIAGVEHRETSSFFHSESRRAEYAGDGLAAVRRKELKRCAGDPTIWAKAFFDRIENLIHARDRAEDDEQVKVLARQIKIADRALELWSTEIAMFAESLRDALADQLVNEYGDDAGQIAGRLRSNSYSNTAYLGKL